MVQVSTASLVCMDCFTYGCSCSHQILHQLNTGFTGAKLRLFLAFEISQAVSQSRSRRSSISGVAASDKTDYRLSEVNHSTVLLIPCR